MIWVPGNTMEQGGVLLGLPPSATAPVGTASAGRDPGTCCDSTGIPSGELGTSSAAPGHPPVHLVSDEPQHGQGLQGNLKLHHLCLLLQLLWRDRSALGFQAPFSRNYREVGC